MAPNEPRKRFLGIAGWVYVAYAVIMLLGHGPTLLRELSGGYSRIEFSNVEPTFGKRELHPMIGHQHVFS